MKINRWTLGSLLGSQVALKSAGVIHMGPQIDPKPSPSVPTSLQVGLKDPKDGPPRWPPNKHPLALMA